MTPVEHDELLERNLNQIRAAFMSLYTMLATQLEGNELAESGLRYQGNKFCEAMQAIINALPWQVQTEATAEFTKQLSDALQRRDALKRFYVD